MRALLSSPHVVRAKYETAFRIRLTFNDGLEATVDFQPWLEGSVFEPLKKLPYFRKYFLDGGTVVWPNGADIAPETLYEAARTSRSSMARPSTAAGASSGRRG
jgi:hypothetical protein